MHDSKYTTPGRKEARWVTRRKQRLPTVTPSAWKSMPSGFSKWWGFLYHKQMYHLNQDITGENCVCYDEVALTDTDMMKAWIKHHTGLLNVEFEWPSGELCEVSLTAHTPSPHYPPPPPPPIPIIATTLIWKARWNTAKLLVHLAS